MFSAQVPQSRSASRGVLVALAVALLDLATPTSVFADGPFQGEWTATSKGIGIELQSWGEDCPGGIPLRQTERGGTVRITQSGDHLTFSGAVRGSTQQCWSDQPGLRRTGATVQGTTWTIRCSTPPNTAQGETGTYTFRAEGQDRIVFTESTRWDWSLRNSRCTATRRSRQTFNRVVEESAVAEPEQPEPANCTPGRPSRLVISPRRAELHAGERVCFRTRVTDSAGCRVPDQPVRLSLDSAEGRSARIDGQCFFAGETAADAEGTFRVQATSGTLGASARVTVAIDDLTDLVAQGSSSMVPTSTGNAEAAGASGVAARAADGGGGFQLWWLGAGLGVLLLIGLSVVFVVRGRKGPEEEEAPFVAPPAAVAATPTAAADDAIRAAGATTKRPERVCPVCDHEADADTEFCPNDGARLLDPESPEVKAQGMICPTCRRGYAAGSARCSADGDELLPYAFFVARQKHEEAAGKKVCPKCGTTYGPEKTFCGQDGTPLETVN